LDPEQSPVKSNQPTGDSHKPGGRLPLLSIRPVVTFPVRGHHHPLTGTKLSCSVKPRLYDEANMKQTYSIYTCMTWALSLLHVCFNV